ncbi:MAG: alpha/beta hydrolase [Cytophagaceae bacterium]
MSTHYVIIPGYAGSGETHWQSYFERNLPNSTRIQPESWEQPTCDNWVEAIQKEVSKFPAETVVLISHSLGCIALSFWARKYTTKIKGAMIVAPPDIENPWQDYGFETFLPIPKDKLPFPSFIIASTNDHWATVERTKEFANNWGCPLTFIGDAGHISAGSGHGDWKEGLEMLHQNFN